MTTDFSAPLLLWYGQHKRDLPWRRDPTPYRVWVSEIMLQQTRIEAARSYYERFMAAFPTVQSLAAADEDTVLKLWEGLGYYSRARNLHAAAKRVTEEYGGEFPSDFASLRALPGVGDYTAAAIVSIAFNLPEGAVDGNVMRLLSRLERCGESIAAPAYRKRVRAALRAMSPAGRCGDFTSALMELGEVVCTPGVPHCAQCPLSSLCAAHAAGEEALYPVIPPKKQRRVEERNVLLLLCGDKVALRRRPATGLLARLWEYPDGPAPAGAEPCGEAIHIFTHVEWHMQGYLCRCAEELPGYVWVTAEERAALAIPTAFRVYSDILDKLGH